MPQTIIDRLYSDNQELIEYLLRQGEISFQSNVYNNFRKTLLLSVASYFEDTLTKSIINFVEEQVGATSPLSYFIQSKAIKRQYHTYFDWNAKNANQFFGLFGPEFRKFMSDQGKADAQLEAAIAAFLELGQTRNELVHQNFAAFTMEKTAEEIYQLYQQALFFVEAFPEKLREYVAQPPA